MKNRFFERNTYNDIIKNDFEDYLDVEIGDSKKDDFYPQVKIKRWDNEVNFSLRLKEDQLSEVFRQEGGIIIYEQENYDCRFYHITGDEYGNALEFDIVLKSKPSTNVLTFTIRSKDLEFFYQPPLTVSNIPHPLDDISSITETEARNLVGEIVVMRPEPVVGSYAVYHKLNRDHTEGGKNYNFGKAFHIFRPKIRDANGIETWGQLSIDPDNDLLTITIEQDWLNSATYPVTVDPTFGHDFTGGSSQSIEDSIRGINATPGSSGTVTKISSYLYNNQDLDSGRHMTKAALYSDRSSDELIAQTNETQVHGFDGGSATWAWWDFAFSANPSITGSTEYQLACWSESGIGFNYIAYDSGAPSGNYITYKNATYGSNFPDPYNPNSESDNRKLAIYATYTESGGGGWGGKVNTISSPKVNTLANSDISKVNGV